MTPYLKLSWKVLLFLSTDGSSLLETSSWHCYFASLNCNKGSNMVYPQFLLSSQPFFIFSGCLMSIRIKREGSWEFTFSKKRVRWFTSFANLLVARGTVKMATPKRSSLGTRLRMNFLTYHGLFWNFATLEEHNKREIWVVGRSGCGLSINMKGTNAAKNSGYFPACSVVVMLKIEARSVCTRMRGCSSAPARNKSRKNHFYARTRTEFCCECWLLGL